MFRESIPKDENIFLVCVFSVAAVFLQLHLQKQDQISNFTKAVAPAGSGGTDGGNHSTDHDSLGVKEANVRWWCQKP